MNQKRVLRSNKIFYGILGAFLCLSVFFLYTFFLNNNYIFTTRAQEQNMPQDLSQQLKDFGLFNTPQDIVQPEAISPTQIVNTNEEQKQYTSIESFFDRIDKKQEEINIGDTILEKTVSTENPNNETSHIPIANGTKIEEKSTGILGFFNKLSQIGNTNEPTMPEIIPEEYLGDIASENLYRDPVVKIKKEKEITESDLLAKGFEKERLKFKGKMALDLSESQGTIPCDISLDSADEEVTLDIPADTIFKTRNNEEYTGIFIPPTKEATLGALTKKTNIIKAGSVDQPIELVDSNGDSVYATIQMKVDRYNLGELVNVYTSEDGNNRELLTKTNIKENTTEKYVSFQTNHFSIFALGSSTGTFTINNDGFITTGTYVSLNGSMAGATRMRFSLTGSTLQNATRGAYATSTGFYLSGLTNGIAVVYAEYSGGGISSKVSDSIVLDTFSHTIKSGLLANIDGTTVGQNLAGTNFTNTNGVMSSFSGENIMAFNGTSAYATSASNLLAAYPFTFSAWMKASRFTTFQAIIDNGRTTVTERGIGLTGNKVVLAVNNGTMYYSTGISTIQTGKRYHIVGVFNSATDKRLYINGQLDHSFTTSTAYASHSAVRIRVGAKGGTVSSYFSGNIDEARVYNRALTAAEISGLYMRVPELGPLKTFLGSPKIYGFSTEKMYKIDIDACGNTDVASLLGNSLRSFQTADCIPVGYATGLDYTKIITGTYTKVYGNTGKFVSSNGLIVNVPGISYTPAGPTLTTTPNVLAKMMTFDSTRFLSNNGGQTGYTFNDNGNFTFNLGDQAGNTGDITAIVDWISFLSFSGVTSGSTYGYYTGATITFSGNFLSGAIVSGLNNSYRNVNFQSGSTINGATTNSGGKYIFTMYDTSGNSTGATFTIVNLIDSTLSSNVSTYNSGSFIVTGTFSEDVTNFSLSKISGSNISFSNLTTINNQLFSRTATPISDGPVSIRINSGVVRNGSNNPNRESNIINTTYDTTTPTLLFNGETSSNYWGTTITTFSGQIQITEKNLFSFKWNRSGSNYNIYDSGLILMMNFDNKASLGETAGETIKDLSLYEQDGTGYNTPTWTGDGKRGGAYNFNGTNNYIQVSNFNHTSPEFSVSFWINPKTRTDSNQNIGASMSSWGTFRFYTTTGGAIYVGTDATNRLTPTQLPDNTLELNTRQHFIFTYQGSTGSLYKNGILLGAKTMNAPGSRSNFFVGTNDANTINGSIDELRVYNRGLSSGEVSQLYKSNLSKVDTDSWIFKTIYTDLAYGEYIYTGYITDLVGYTTSTGRIIHIDPTELVYLPTDTTNSTGIVQYFQSKGYTYTATGLVGTTGINLQKTNIICPQVPLNLESTGNIGGNKVILELPVCLKILSEGSDFTGIIESPRIVDKSFTLINHTQDSSIFIGSTGNQISFIETGNSDATTGKIHIPTPSKDLGTMVDIYSSQDNVSRTYEGTGEVISKNGEKYVTIETIHLTYFNLGTYTGNFVINNDNASTTSTDVTLHMNVEGATYMKFGNTQEAAESASWIAYSTGYDRALTQEFGTKTVYALFTDGTNTGYVNDSITLSSNTTINSMYFTPDLDLSYFSAYTFSANISGNINTGSVDIIGINGDGNNCIEYYASGSCASTGGITSFSYPLIDSGNNIRKTQAISPDNLYPRIFFANSETMNETTGATTIINQNNYTLAHIENPFTMTGNQTLRIELGTSTGLNEDVANLEIYLVQSGTDLSFFNTDWRSETGTQFIGTLNKNTPYSHTHEGSEVEAHHLIALSTNSDGSIGSNNIKIDGDFRILLYANTSEANKSRSLKYLSGEICQNSSGWYIGNSTARTTSRNSGCPDIHMHIARKSTPPGGTSPDGIQVITYANYTGGTTTGTQTFYFETSNIAPNPSSFITPIQGGYFSGDINISRYPATDGNMDPVTYSISLLNPDGTMVEELTGNTTEIGFIRDSTSVNDGEYILSGSIDDGLIKTVFYLNNPFIIDNTNPAIVFTGATPASGETISSANFSGSIEIAEENTNAINRNRNGQQLSLYNTDILLLMNFDNLAIFNEDVNTVKDFSLYNNTGTIYGASYTSNGKRGGAYTYDGISDYIQTQIGSGYNPSTSDLSISIRVKPKDLNSDQIVASFGDNGSNQRSFIGLQGGKRDIGIQTNDRGVGTTDADNNRTHITLVFNSDTDIATLFINGKYSLEKSYTNYQFTDNLRLSRNDYPFSGSIDELRIYGYALSTGDIQQLYSTNLAKTSENNWLFSTQQSCLPEDTYTYDISVTDLANNISTTGSTILLSFPPLSVGTPTSGLNITGLSVSIASDTKEFTFTGGDNTFRINDTKGYTGWYTTIQLSGDLTNEAQTKTLPRKNIEFKASDSILTMQGKSSSGVQLATGINEYKVMTGIFNYLVKNITPECSSCIVGKYGNNPALKITISDEQSADVYNGTLIFTLYEESL